MGILLLKEEERINDGGKFKGVSGKRNVIDEGIKIERSLFEYFYV